MPRLLYKPDRVFSLHNSPGPHVQRLIQRRASYWSCLRDSDSRPVDYESTALPTELKQHAPVLFQPAAKSRPGLVSVAHRVRLLFACPPVASQLALVCVPVYIAHPACVEPNNRTLRLHLLSSGSLCQWFKNAYRLNTHNMSCKCMKCIVFVAWKHKKTTPKL